MSELEFQRELSPEQIREALSLLYGAAGAQKQDQRIGDLRLAEEVDPKADQPSTTKATQDRPLAAEDQEQCEKYLNLLLVVASYGLGIAAAGALALMLWHESTPIPPSLPGITHEQLPYQTAAPPAKIASPAVPVAIAAPDRNPEQPTSTPDVAGSNLIGHTNPDDQAAVRGAANSDGAIPYAADPATVPPIATEQARWEQLANQKPGQPWWWHARAVRVAAARKRFWRRHWRARAETNAGECFLVCLSWRAQHTVAYEPPRNVTQ